MCAGNKPTLFSRLGGIEAVRAVVDEFYGRILKDDKLMGFFNETSMVVLKLHQVSFMKLAFTQIPEDVDPVALLTDKHQRLFEKGLNGEHFDMVAGHFVGALQHAGVPQALIDEAAGVVLPLRPVFVAGAEKFGPKPAKQEEQQDEQEEKKEEEEVVAVSQESAEKKLTIADKLGGTPALKVAVEEFYTRILADADLAMFFKNTSMVVLKMHQVAFMKIAFTKIPDDLDVMKLLKEKHAHLIEQGLNGTHFDKVAGHFVETLQSLNVPPELIGECVGIVAPLRAVFE